MASVTPEGKENPVEQPLTLQLTKESQLMISKLEGLGLNDPSAPGMTVFGDNGNQIAILHGGLSVQEASAQAQGQQDSTKEEYFVISPKGFFLAEGKSTLNRESLLSTLKNIKNRGQELIKVSIDNKYNLRIDDEDYKSFPTFKMKRIDSTPQEFRQMLTLAIENSRKIAQKPLLEEIARAKEGNTMLDDMIQEEKSSSVSSSSAPPLYQPPTTLGPAGQI